MAHGEVQFYQRLQVLYTSSEKQCLVSERLILRSRAAEGWELSCWYFCREERFLENQPYLNALIDFI